MFLADLHVHSNFSDGQMSIPDVVDLYGRLGFGAIALTDHLCETKTFLGKVAQTLERTLTIKTLVQYRDIIQKEALRAWDQYRMVLIPGVEISKNYLANHRSAHFLILGTTEIVSAEEDVAEICDRGRELDALSIAAHPVPAKIIEYQTLHLWNRRKELKEKFDAWEISSGPALLKEVQNERLPIVASSDFHKPSHLKSWKTVFQCDRSQEAIFDAIRRQDLSITQYSVPMGDWTKALAGLPQVFCPSQV